MSIPRYHIQNIKDVQYGNVNMSWGYRKFTHYSVAAERYKKYEGILLFHIIITG